MSNETKRDVFDEVLDEWQVDETMPDANWKYPDFKLVRIKEERFKDRYAAALPDDLPVIPEAVAYAIEWFQQNDDTIGEVWRNLYEDVDDDWQEAPQLREAEEWMLDNQDTFTRAWLLGQWEAEK